MVANLRSDHLLHADFSGNLCMETAVRMQVNGFARCGLNVKEFLICSWSSSETSPLRRAVILRTKHQPLHLFEDVAAHASPEVQEGVRNLGPPK